MICHTEVSKNIGISKCQTILKSEVNRGYHQKKRKRPEYCCIHSKNNY